MSSDALAIASLLIALSSLILSLVLLSKLLRLSKVVTLFLRGIRSRVLRSYVRSVEEWSRRRVRKRYLVFELIVKGSAGSISEERLNELVKRYFRELFGSIELSRAGINVVLLDRKRLRGIIRYNSRFRSKLIMALAAMQVSEGLIVNPLRTTGTLRKAMKYAGITK